MLEEDVILKDCRYSNERILMFFISTIVLLPALFDGGNSIIGHALVMSFALIVPVNIISYPINWIDAPHYSRLRFLLCILPYLAIFAFYTYRLNFPILETIDTSGGKAFIINDELIKNPLSASYSSVSDVLSALGINFAIIASALSLYFITQSRFVLRNTIAFCGMGVLILTIFGFILNFFSSTGSGDYLVESFSTFSDSSEWSLFAMIWASLIFGASIYTFQKFSLREIVFSVRTYSMFGASIVYAGAYLFASPLLKTFMPLQLALIFAVFAANVFPTKASLEKHIYSKKKRALNYSRFFPFVGYILIAMFFAAVTLFSYVNYKKISEEQDMRLAQAIEFSENEDTKKLIEERKFFGWGVESFPELFAFNKSDDVSGYVKTPNTSWLKICFEYGYVGVGAILLVPSIFACILIYRRKISQSGVIFLSAIILGGLIALNSAAFESNSAALSFCILLAIFFRWENSEII